MAGQMRIRQEFQADRGEKKAESSRGHVATKEERFLPARTLPVNHQPHEKT